jgi:hypothetical protein
MNKFVVYGAYFSGLVLLLIATPSYFSGEIDVALIGYFVVGLPMILVGYLLEPKGGFSQKELLALKIVRYLLLAPAIILLIVDLFE